MTAWTSTTTAGSHRSSDGLRNQLRDAPRSHQAQVEATGTKDVIDVVERLATGSTMSATTPKATGPRRNKHMRATMSEATASRYGSGYRVRPRRQRRKPIASGLSARTGSTISVTSRWDRLSNELNNLIRHSAAMGSTAYPPQRGVGSTTSSTTARRWAERPRPPQIITVE